MKLLRLLMFLLYPFMLFAQQPVEKYDVDSASVVHPGVPKGEVLKFTFQNSKIYPGTFREYWVYIPAQYDPAKPACLFVDQDNIQFKTPTVFDNLIYNKQMPVTIGVFITPGRVVAADTLSLDRYNRSFEYDALGDAYVRFLLDELLPDVEKHKAADGRQINLSKNGNDRAIGGTSSGAICAFTAAWERPDAFSRVFSGIGTYVSLRGGDRYPSLIRKYEPKPIRVFIQDGSHDNNIYAGDWFFANQMMVRSLEFAGYEVNHTYGEGTHNGNQATALFPDVMRWLWKDYPTPVKAGLNKNAFLHDILIPGEDWQQLDEKAYHENGAFKPAKIANLGSKPNGQVFFKTMDNETFFYLNKDDSSSFVYPVPVTTLAVSRKFYKNAKGNQTVDLSKTDGIDKITAPHIFQGNDIIKANTPNNLYYITGADGTPEAGKVFLVKKDFQKVLVDQGLKNPYGMALTPDHTQLYVTESNSHWLWIYNIKPDGTLTNKQHYGWLYVPDDAENAQATAIKCDRDGRVYVATNMGIQVLDQTGRVNAILPLPLNAGQPTQICFGYKNFDKLFVVCGNKIYHRKLNVKGLNDFDAAIKPAKPRL